MPERIQLRRSRGWRKPPGTVVVARPTRWGNPYAVDGRSVRDRAHAVELYREMTAGSPELCAAARAELAGRDLACWCPLTAPDSSRGPCHADVLLEIANSPP